ncbi:unnamed protein product [Psylliodes chrysocephalus]|uniref:Myb-like domain-containing protein n=1 Tax=Psylliodes chrysocephalus TaxID=3402493 RepID=A0A9P0CUG1_9CUCU|nr:unnamed protein product [Psylliodes chrysocephala]
MGLVNQKIRTEVPADLIEVFKEARVKPSPFRVLECSQSMFRKWMEHLGTFYKKKALFQTRPIREYRVSREHPRLVSYRTSFNGAWETAEIRGPSYKYRQGLTEKEFRLPALSYKEVEDNINPSIELIENRQAETDENLIRTTWSREEILSLINLYEEYEKKFKSTTIKNDKVWQEISSKIPSHTWEQCKNKFKYLKSKYIEKKDNMGAKATGAKAIRFDYFDKMEKIFRQHPNVAPVATASSSRGICNITSISSTSCHQEIYASLIPEQKNEKRKAIEEMPEEKNENDSLY